MSSNSGSSGGSSGGGSSGGSLSEGKRRMNDGGSLDLGAAQAAADTYFASASSDSTKGGAAAAVAPSFATDSFPVDKGGAALDTTVTQAAAANAAVDGAAGAPEGTGTPRSDFSVVLAGQTARRPDRSPSRSNNFVSLIGEAGGLGRRSDTAKRTLIGGA